MEVPTSEIRQTHHHHHPKRHIHGQNQFAARGICRTTTVHPGDGCYAVAQRCGISQSDLKNYNDNTEFCGTLVPGQTVCCSAGALPAPIPSGNADGTCKTKSAVAGDSCASLAQKCGLKPADFTALHNSDRNFCSTLAVGQRVCCTYGELPDITPEPGEDGACFVYTIKKGDGCSTIAVSHGLGVDQIEKYNKHTWGWNGCKVLYSEAQLCLSIGTPPFPAPISNAVCGPQVPGTKQPLSGSSEDWANLNPCPLNVCCNIWGQCGTTDDFCVISKSETGAPGTSAPGENGYKLQYQHLLMENSFLTMI